MWKSRGIGVLAVAGATALALSGCQQGSASNGDSDSGGETVTLSFQSLSDQPATQEAIGSIVDEWNAENPDVQVEVVQAGWDGIYDKLITQFTGGTAPDIIHFEAASIIPFALDGYLADLGDLVEPDIKDDISDGIWESVTVDDAIIAYPSTLQSYMVFANTDLLEAAGVEIPTGDTMSWDELREIAQATTDADTFGLGWGLGSPTATIMSLSLGFGGGYFEGEGEDVTIDVGPDETAVPERIHEMAYDDKSLDPTSLTQSGSDVLASFYGGTIAMTVQGSFQATNIANDAPDGFNWTVLPPLEGTEGALQSANPQTYSVNVDSEYVEESADFLNFLMSPENLASIAFADALIPSSGAAQAAVEEQAAGATGWDQIIASAEGLTAPPFLKVSRYAEWKDTIATPAFQQYLGNQIDIEELTRQLTDGWTEVNG